MANLLSQNSSRGGGNFSFSTSDDFSFVNTLGSLVYPPVSQVEGWYYFGFASIVLILIFILAIPWIKKEKWASENGGKTWKYWFLDPWVVGTLSLFFIIISYITYGKNSILFIFLWKYFPFFSHLRFIGRLNVVLLPGIALILAISIDFLTILLKNIAAYSESQGNQMRRWLWLCLTAFVIPAGVQIYLLFFQEEDFSWSDHFYHFSGQEPFFAVMAGLTFVFLILTSFFIKKKRLPSFLWVVFTILVLADMWHVSAYMWWNGTLYSVEDKRRPLNIVDYVFKESFQQQRDPAYIEDSISLTSRYRIHYSDDWYFSRYRDFYVAHDNEPEARAKLLGVVDAQRIFYSHSISQTVISDFLNDASSKNYSLEILKFNGDRLEIMVDVPEDGYISYIDNWDPDWKVYVNGKDVPVEKLFSTFKSVKVPRGASNIVFSYEPGFFSFPSWSQK
jgi:hypothetical protein